MFLWIMHALTASLLGFCSAIAYGFDKPVRQQISGKVCVYTPDISHLQLHAVGLCRGCTSPPPEDAEYYSDSQSDDAANFEDGNVELQ